MTETVKAQTAAIASGDTEAFSRFYQRWFDFAFIETRRASGGRDEQFCLDIVQDSMMRVIRSIRQMDDEASIQRWLRIVVRSCCYDRIRRDLRRSRRESACSADSTGAQKTADMRDRMDWLHEQLCNMNASEAGLLAMRFRLGWTLQRIGSALGLKPGAVDGRISRSLAALRAKAQEDFHEL